MQAGGRQMGGMQVGTHEGSQAGNAQESIEVQEGEMAQEGSSNEDFARGCIDRWCNTVHMRGQW